MSLLQQDFPNGSISNEYMDMDLISTTDRNGNFDYKTYDSQQRLIDFADPRGYETEYTYCGCGALESVTDPLANVSAFNYDYAKRRVNTVFFVKRFRKKSWDFLPWRRAVSNRLRSTV